jgi:hypothetical protein
MGDYTKTILSSLSKADTYDVIALKMSDWWGDTTGIFGKIGDTATVSFGNDGPAKWKFEAEVLDRPSHIILKCIDEDWNDTSEWIGTSLVFKFNDHEKGSSIEFTHQGLNSDLKCFDLCEMGWNKYLEESLFKVLNLK